jgi:peptidyl-prolyl cis-trans isomerase B (cyclophilin B)
VARTRDRQRALARAKLERQIARRAAAARRRRQIQAGTAAGLALVVVVLGVLWVAGVFEPDKDKPVAAGDCAWTPQTGGEAKDAGTPPTTGIAKSGTQTMTITTDQGVIEATIDDALTPCTAASFTHLASKNFFDNTKCHRLTTSGIFVLQCGDPSATGTGGPTYRFADENLPEAGDPSASGSPSSDPSASASPSSDPSAAPQTIYKAGTLAMANSGANTNGSQFFIVYADSPLDPKYSVFGTVTKGLDVVEKVAKGGVAEGGSTATDGKPKTEVTIQTLTMTAPNAAPPPADPGASSDPSAPAGSGGPSASNPQS